MTKLTTENLGEIRTLSVTGVDDVVSEPVVTFVRRASVKPRPKPIQRFPAKRETATHIRERRRYRPIIITLHPGFMELRLKGMRMSFTLGYEAAYKQAVWAELESKRLERRKAREEKKKRAGK